MDRQVSYNGPLSSSPLPYNFPASQPSTLMNHPLPQKPPISMHFHAYTPPARRPASPCNMAAQHVGRGKSILANNDREGPFEHHHATASSIGVFSGPHIESVISPSSEDTIPGLENDCDKTSSIDSVGDDLPHSDKLFSWILNNSDAESCKASAALQNVDDRPCLDETSSTTSEGRCIGLSCESLPGDADDADDDRNDDIHPTKHLSDGSEGGLSDTLGPKGLLSSCQLVEEPQTTFSGCRGPQPVTETTVCSPSENSRSKRHSRKKPAYIVLGYAELAAGRGPRTRARARAEASASFLSCRRSRPYSDAEDELLCELVNRKLQWEQIEEEFGRRFAGRDRKSLQGRWSRNLKFVTRSAKCLTTRGARDGAA
ncbi:hypothetical protein BDV06DRAFT_111890 [Aspergillus oleicola]